MALTGFFTDMALSWFLDRPVIYTPLKICSIYAGVIGAVATAAGIVLILGCANKKTKYHSLTFLMILVDPDYAQDML